MNENWVLTSAHCVYGLSLRPNQINVGYASNDLLDMVDQNKLVNVQWALFHPDFQPAKPNHPVEYSANLALLKLATPFKFNDNVQPACLELDHPRKFEEPLLSLGFGVTEVFDLGTSFKLGNNSRYLKETWQEEHPNDLIFCRYENLNETICLSGKGIGK